MSIMLYKMGATALVAALITVLVTPLVKKLAIKAEVVRSPRDRDAHTEPTPLWGGVAMLVGFLVAFLLLRMLFTSSTAPVPLEKIEVLLPFLGHRPIVGILIGGMLVAGVGMLDDRGDLKPSLQTLALAGAAVVAALFGARIPGLTNPFNGGAYIALPLWLSLSLTVIWVFAAAKTFDFLDGLDGLAAGVCAIAGTTMCLVLASQPNQAVVALMAAALVGASLGFLRYNYNPASIFMGTVGSLFLGFVLAELAIIGASKIPAAISVAIPLLVLSVPVGDGIYVAGRRIVEKRPATQAAKDHIHHRLVSKGMSVKQAVWTIYALTAGTCLVALFLAWKWGR